MKTIQRIIMICITVSVSLALSEGNMASLTASCEALNSKSINKLRRKKVETNLIGENLNGGIYNPGKAQDEEEEEYEDDENFMFRIQYLTNDSFAENVISEIGILTNLHTSENPIKHFFINTSGCKYKDDIIEVKYKAAQGTMLDILTSLDETDGEDEEDGEEIEEDEESSEEEEEPITLAYRLFIMNYLTKALLSLHKESILVTRLTIENIFQNSRYDLSIGNLAYIQKEAQHENGLGVIVDKDGRNPLFHTKMHDYRELGFALYSLLYVFREDKLINKGGENVTVTANAAGKFKNLSNIKFDALNQSADVSNHLYRACENQEKYSEIINLKYFCQYFKTFIAAFLLNEENNSNNTEFIEGKFDEWFGRALTQLKADYDQEVNKEAEIIEDEEEEEEEEEEEPDLSIEFDFAAVVEAFLEENKDKMTEEQSYKLFVTNLLKPFHSHLHPTEETPNLQDYKQQINQVQVEREMLIV